MRWVYKRINTKRTLAAHEGSNSVPQSYGMRLVDLLVAHMNDVVHQLRYA